MAVPSILSMIVVIIYNMADTFFIGQTGNPLMVSAISLCSPLFLIFTACSSIFGIGGSSTISRSLGMDQRDRTKKICAFCCYGTLILGLVIGALILLCMPILLSLIGADDTTYTFTKKYLTWIAIGGPFIVFSGAFGSLIRSEGASKDAMLGNIAGSVTNIILDPIMILVFDMGGSWRCKCYCDRQHGRLCRVYILLFSEADIFVNPSIGFQAELQTRVGCGFHRAAVRL